VICSLIGLPIESTHTELAYLHSKGAHHCLLLSGAWCPQGPVTTHHLSHLDTRRGNFLDMMCWAAELYWTVTVVKERTPRLLSCAKWVGAVVHSESCTDGSCARHQPLLPQCKPHGCGLLCKPAGNCRGLVAEVSLLAHTVAVLQCGNVDIPSACDPAHAPGRFL
jgi:hypothetical protein